MIGIVLASILAAVYTAYVIWIAFSNNAGTQPKPSTREGFGLVFMALGAPLILGGLIAAIGWPAVRGTALVAAAAGVMGVALSVVMYGHGESTAVMTSFDQQQASATSGQRAARLADSEPGWVLVAVGLLLIACGGLVIWRADPSLRLGGILAVVTGAGLFAAGMAPMVLADAEAPGWWRRDFVVLAVLTITATSASAVVLLLAARIIHDSPAFTRRYGVQVDAQPVPGSCTTTVYRARPPKRSCEATWEIGNETGRGTLIFTRDARIPRGQLRPAHVLDATSTTAYTAPLEGMPPPDGSYLALGRIPSPPLLPAFIIHVVAWALVRLWLLPRRKGQTARSLRG